MSVAPDGQGKGPIDSRLDGGKSVMDNQIMDAVRASEKRLPDS